jgi:hypothetical protein
MISEISNDVLLIIRSYIFIFRFEEDAEAGEDEFETFVRQESEKSWTVSLYQQQPLLDNSEKRTQNLVVE